MVWPVWEVRHRQLSALPSAASAACVRRAENQAILVERKTVKFASGLRLALDSSVRESLQLYTSWGGMSHVNGIAGI